jgi:hypothetical protein
MLFFSTGASLGSDEPADDEVEWKTQGLQMIHTSYKERCGFCIYAAENCVFNLLLRAAVLYKIKLGTKQTPRMYISVRRYNVCKWLHLIHFLILVGCRVR